MAIGSLDSIPSEGWWTRSGLHRPSRTRGNLNNQERQAFRERSVLRTPVVSLTSRLPSRVLGAALAVARRRAYPPFAKYRFEAMSFWPAEGGSTTTTKVSGS